MTRKHINPILVISLMLFGAARVDAHGGGHGGGGHGGGGGGHMGGGHMGGMGGGHMGGFGGAHMGGMGGAHMGGFGGAHMGGMGGFNGAHMGGMGGAHMGGMGGFNGAHMGGMSGARMGGMGGGQVGGFGGARMGGMAGSRGAMGSGSRPGMNMSGRSLANSGFGRGGIGGAGASGFGRGGIGGAGGANGFGRGGLNGSALGASRGNFGYGARAPISSAARLGGANAFGRGGMNNRAGAGLTSTAFNRGGFSNNSFNNNSFNLNRASFTNNVNVNSNRFGGGGFGRSGYYGGWGYGRNGYGGWGNGGWGNGGWGNGGWGWGNRGWGWGGNGWGGGWGWGGGGWGGGWGYGGLGLGWGGLGWGWGGLGWGWGGLGGWGWGNGYGWGGYGMGLWPWLYGSSLYNWGYLNYYNPYYYGGYGLAGFGYPVSTTVVVQPTVYDYSQPINTQATPPAPSVADQVGNGFDAARDAFKAGDYTRALELADQAIKQMPNDAALHEFRGVVLFALHRYEDAAAPLYAVLSVGPGWDWGTFVGLYPDVGVYTEQLRALENYCNANPNSAAPRFVLAYLYLTQGHSDQALAQLKRVVALQPKDMISARLIQRLETTSTPNAGAPNPLPAAAPAAPATNLNPTSLKEGRLEGAWTAQPDPETTITLTFLDQGRFVWKVTHKGQDRLIQGKLTTGNGLLTLAQDMGSPMVGNLMWLDESHFTFKVPGSGADDAGLSFSKAP